MTSIVISESTLKKGIGEVYDSLIRYYEFRLTPWVYSTRGSVKEILSAGGFFGQSPLSTILHEPLGTYSQTSIIHPIKLHRLIGQINEPGFTSCIPSLTINKKDWSEKNKPEPKLAVNGAIFIKNDVFKSFIPIKELNGLRWIQKGAIRAGIPVPNKKEPAVQVVVEKPKAKLKLDKAVGGLRYNIDMNARAYIVNRTNNNFTNLKQLTQTSAAVIEQEIRHTFQSGLKKETDVFNLEHNLFRYHYESWKNNSSVEQNVLKDMEIQDIHIDLNIEHSSSEKNSTIRKGEGINNK